MFQYLINKTVNWFHKDAVDKFDQKRAEIIKGRQFPNKNEVSKQIDFAINNFDGNKITTDFLSHYKNNTDTIGIDHTTDTSESS